MYWQAAISWLAVFQLVGGSFLLPGDVRPSHYDLRVTYDLDPATNYSYYGVVDILLAANKPTSKIILHAKDFNITSESILISGQQNPPTAKSAIINSTYDFLTITLDRMLDTDVNYTVTIPFYGNLKQGLDGVYISSYVNRLTKVTEYLITTQFEAISARKGFPCFDEPMYKATYRITLGHHKQFTAVSNMPLKSRIEENVLEKYWPWQIVQQKFGKNISQFVWDEFDESVPMSTYLVAFVVSNFSHVESPADLSTTKFRIWARSDAIDQTSYAANIGPRVLTHFEKFFNVSFPLPKQDMFAIPDFSAGAMENWGLITYRETALLYDKQQSSFLNKERVAEVIAHELAHQWFGNLVTMKWWSDLWLNEGFATFMASVGVDAVEPNWRADRSYAVENIMSILKLDALESSHPVSVPIDDPKRISEIFDTISYKKGSTLIRMMTMFLGEDVFKKALHNYLIKYSYKNAEQDDLWHELTHVSHMHGRLAGNMTVKQVMDTWTKQTGYPILTVTRDYTDQSLTIAQKRYLSLSARSGTGSSWWVPLRVLCEADAAAAEDLQWLSDTDGVSSLHQFKHNSQPEQWVLFNYDMLAPYRVNYDKKNWMLLSNALNSDRYTSVPVLGRVQLLSDAFALAWTNRLDYSIALELASYLKRENEVLPLTTGLTALGTIDNVLSRSPEYGAFQKYMRRLITDTYQRAGGLAVKKILNGDNLNSVKLQVMTSQWACRMKVPGCEENAIELFQQWMDTSDPDKENPIPLDLRRTVYCVALRRGSVRHWRFALARMQRANVAAARDKLLGALACTNELWILNQYLEWTITEGSVIRRQDAATVIASITRSTIGYYVAKEFIYDHIAELHKTFRGQANRIGGIVKILLDQFTTQRELDEFNTWREKHATYLSEVKLAVQQAVERAAVNIAWVARHRQHLARLLRDHAIKLQTPHITRWKGQPNFMLSIFAIHNISTAGVTPFRHS